MDIFSISGLILTIVTIGGGVIAGLLYLVGIFGGKRDQDNQEANEANEYVIRSLKEKIEVLQQQMIEATSNLIATNKRLDDLQHENKLLREILQGRDATTQQYYQAGYDSMATVKELVTVTKENHNILLEIRNNQPQIMTTTTTITGN